jgi:hypothetical protein
MGLLGDPRRSVAAMFGRRRHDDPGRGRVLPWELGLERFPPRGVLVQFSSPGSAQCRISLNRLAAAASAYRGEAIVVELLVEQQSRVAERMGVRMAPTVLQLDGRGDVLRRWTRPPDRRDLEQALDSSPLLTVDA